MVFLSHSSFFLCATGLVFDSLASEMGELYVIHSSPAAPSVPSSGFPADMIRQDPPLWKHAQVQRDLRYQSGSILVAFSKVLGRNLKGPACGQEILNEPLIGGQH